MNFPRWFLVLLGALVASSSVEAGTEMDRAFGRLERDFKKLKTALEAPQEADRDFYQQKVEEMLVEARRARGMEPEMMAKVPEAEREQFLERFRNDMDAFIANIEKLQDALKNSRWDEARQVMETLWQNKKSGHKAFMKRK
jgi:soluble cytochrome b562